MALESSRIGASLWRKARSNVGVRFTRFTVVAVASVVASQVALALLIDEAHLTAGLSGGLAAMIGAAVSYILSRWAWERKGKPDLLRETLPFWLVAIVVWVILALAAKLGVHLATSMHAPKGSLENVAIRNGTYFAANCVTFVLRFALFHYVLFADSRSSRAPVPAEPPMRSSSDADGPDGADEAGDDSEPLAGTAAAREAAAREADTSERR